MHLVQASSDFVAVHPSKAANNIHCRLLTTIFATNVSVKYNLAEEVL